MTEMDASDDILSKLTPAEQKKFDDALASMLAHLDSSPAMSTRLCVLRVQLAADNLFEMRVARYPTAAEWRVAIKFIENILAADLTKIPRPPKTTIKRKKK